MDIPNIVVRQTSRATVGLRPPLHPSPTPSPSILIIKNSRTDVPFIQITKAVDNEDRKMKSYGRRSIDVSVRSKNRKASRNSAKEEEEDDEERRKKEEYKKKDSSGFHHRSSVEPSGKSENGTHCRRDSRTKLLALGRSLRGNRPEDLRSVENGRETTTEEVVITGRFPGDDRRRHHRQYHHRRIHHHVDSSYDSRAESSESRLASSSRDLGMGASSDRGKEEEEDGEKSSLSCVASDGPRSWDSLGTFGGSSEASESEEGNVCNSHNSDPSEIIDERGGGGRGKGTISNSPLADGALSRPETRKSKFGFNPVFGNNAEIERFTGGIDPPRSRGRISGGEKEEAGSGRDREDPLVICGLPYEKSRCRFYYEANGDGSATEAKGVSLLRDVSRGELREGKVLFVDGRSRCEPKRDLADLGMALESCPRIKGSRRVSWSPPRTSNDSHHSRYPRTSAPVGLERTIDAGRTCLARSEAFGRCSGCRRCRVCACSTGGHAYK